MKTDLFLLAEEIIVKKVSIKTRSEKYAGTEDWFRIEVCGQNKNQSLIENNCCTFDIAKNSLKEPNGELDLSSESLGNCSDYPINSEVKYVRIFKTGNDNWFGDHIAVETSSEVRFCMINEETRNIHYEYHICILKNGKLEFLSKL